MAYTFSLLLCRWLGYKQTKGKLMSAVAPKGKRMGQPISGPSNRDSGAVKPVPDAISIERSGAVDDLVGSRPRWQFHEEKVEQGVQALSRAAGPIVFFAALGGLIWVAIRLF